MRNRHGDQEASAQIQSRLELFQGMEELRDEHRQILVRARRGKKTTNLVQERQPGCLKDRQNSFQKKDSRAPTSSSQGKKWEKPALGGIPAPQISSARSWCSVPGKAALNPSSHCWLSSPGPSFHGVPAAPAPSPAQERCGIHSLGSCSPIAAVTPGQSWGKSTAQPWR